MRRLFWLAMGITIGALVVRKLSRAADKLTPTGIAGSIADGLRDLAEAIGDFGADVRAAAAERASGRGGPPRRARRRLLTLGLDAGDRPPPTRPRRTE